MKHQTRPDKGRVGCDVLPGDTQQTYSPISLRQQFLIERFHLAPAVASAMSVAVFGEAC